MNIPDIINGIYELLGGFFIILHIIRLCIDKMVSGVSLYSVIYFTSWGYWNIFYYPYLKQTMSFIGGIFIAIANTIWVALLIYYSKNNRSWNQKSL